jgi:hypothetical protein
MLKNKIKGGFALKVKECEKRERRKKAKEMRKNQLPAVKKLI